VGVLGDHEDLPPGDCHPPVDVAAAKRGVDGNLVLVAPQLLAGPSVEGERPAVPGRQVHHAVDHDGRRLERVGPLARVDPELAELELPRRAEVFHVSRVDLVELAVALAVVSAVIGEPVMGLRTCLEDPLEGHVAGHRGGFASGPAQRSQILRLVGQGIVGGRVGTGGQDRGGKHQRQARPAADVTASVCHDRDPPHGRGCSGRSRRASSGTSPFTRISPSIPRPTWLPTGQPNQ
jgi:hypothetical protein